MKIKFRETGSLEKFCEMASKLESDVMVKSGSREADGKSLMGLYSLNFTGELDVEVIEKNKGDTEKFVHAVHGLGIML